MQVNISPFYYFLSKIFYDCISDQMCLIEVTTPHFLTFRLLAPIFLYHRQYANIWIKYGFQNDCSTDILRAEFEKRSRGKVRGYYDGISKNNEISIKVVTKETENVRIFHLFKIIFKEIIPLLFFNKYLPKSYNLERTIIKKNIKRTFIFTFLSLYTCTCMYRIRVPIAFKQFRVLFIRGRTIPCSGSTILCSGSTIARARKSHSFQQKVDSVLGCMLGM